jgi:hypothetical protein
VDINQIATPINQQLSMKKVWTFHRPTLTTPQQKGAADSLPPQIKKSQTFA